MLKMSELAERSGVSTGTIKHYLREGLLGGEDRVVRTSRNMAYYPPEFVDRIRLIKRLQEERFMPLKVIAHVMDDDPERMAALIELEDRIIERAVSARSDPAHPRISRAEVKRGYGSSDVRIVEAISRFRAGGYDERIGFTVYDTLRYKRAMEELVKEEVEVITERLGGDVDPELIEKGAEPLRDLIAALHSKALVAELRGQRAARS
jgi:DNA-binding transcriptional MerR regulator